MGPVEGMEWDPEGDLRVRKGLPIFVGEVDIAEILETFKLNVSSSTELRLIKQIFSFWLTD